ncbi:MAG: tetratricopeptide repeat protein [Flavobacteriaceae bacterium]|nr:tetratricopeptide repeat protein [Flavobacteriaceae bacterium]
MKKIAVFILTLSSFISISQNNVIDVLKQKRKSSPIDAIIYADSLLFSNHDYTKKIISKIKYEQAIAYTNNNNHREALELFNEILPIEKDKKRIIKILLLQSNSNVYLKNYSKATNQTLEALDIAKKNNYFNLVSAANSALSFIYYTNKDYRKAFKYLLNTVELQKQQHDSISLSVTYNNIAILHKNTANFKKALQYSQKSLDISLSRKDNIGIGKSYSNIGRINELIGNYKNALAYYKKAIVHNTKSKISNSIPYSNLAHIYTYLKDYKSSEKNYIKALKIAINNSNQYKINLIYKDLLKIAMQQRDFKKALKYQAKSDSVFNITVLHKNKEKIKMLENQHKYFKNKNELLQVKKNNNKNKIIFGVSLSFLLLLGLFWFQNTKRKIVENEKEKLILEQSVLRSQMNPHFIFNTLSAIQNSLLDNEPIKSATYLSRFAKLIRQNFDFISQDRILLLDEIDALKNYMDTQKLRFNDKFDYEINIFAGVAINTVEIPPLLIQPFVENAIEHGLKNKKEKGKITISISKGNNSICYEIKDNGVGYSEKNKEDKVHSIDVFKKRLKLLDRKDEKSFTINSSNKGTVIKFCLKQ